MKNRERILKALNFEAVDRLPVVEWTPWWDKTIDRWKGEGLPNNLVDDGEIREYFGLDRIRHWWIKAENAKIVSSYQETKGYGAGIVSDMENYLRIKEDLYSKKLFDRDKDREMVKKWAVQQKRGEMVIWIGINGFFWFPRIILGIEKHLYAFFDSPELLHAINQDLLEHNLRALEQFCQVCTPDVAFFEEDMSYNHGPMISKSHFDEFIAPYYRGLVSKLKEYGIIPLVDSDGNVESMISWFTDLGVEGFYPLERQSGIDIGRVRKASPEVKIIGAYDKMVMSKGERKMRVEFDRILPAMKQGGYIVSVDHQTPPEVSLEDYRIYLRLLREYCAIAAQ